MAAYAALVSLWHVIDQVQHHSRPPVSLDKIQAASITENIAFLQEFLESCPINIGNEEHKDALETRISRAAYAAEDIIESHIVHQIKAESTSTAENEENVISVDLYPNLEEVIQEMDLIKRDVKGKKHKYNQLHKKSCPAKSLGSPLPIEHSTMIGFDDVMFDVMDKLTHGQEHTLRIIPIVGMGGIETKGEPEGLTQMRNEEALTRMSEHELGEKLHKILSGWRYLIVMDDMWSVELWNKAMFFFPDNNNGSRIMITTRISNLATELTGSDAVNMSFLNEDQSWTLLCKRAFGLENCPAELEETGKKIANNCKGLPLSIVVIGGFLAKSEPTKQQWNYIAENLSSIVNSEYDEHCLKILHMSYDQMPVHLKPLFLYTGGIFPEDSEIDVSRLIKLWMAEGFLKPICGRRLEAAAEDYLNDLIGRNLVTVCKLGSAGNVKTCTVHDLLRDLCVKEAEKDEFFHVQETTHISGAPYGMHDKRRVTIIHRSTSKIENFAQTVDAVQSASLARSLLCHVRGVIPRLSFRLLRVLDSVDESGYIERRMRACSLEDSFRSVNLRYIATTIIAGAEIPASIYCLWNLQTLVVNHLRGDNTAVPLDIWRMTQLRHVKFDQLHLPDPPGGSILLGGLENLRTLRTVRNFRCGQDVAERFPNLKKLGIEYDVFGGFSAYCPENLCLLNKLESLGCSFSAAYVPMQGELVQRIRFLRSLVKLSLSGTGLPWGELGDRVGWLPHLRVLKLKLKSFVGPMWETSEGQFRSLRFLLIELCFDLEQWMTNGAHFPCLEHLVLRELFRLKEIPVDIGNIPTLKSIQLDNCSDSAVISAWSILEEQEELGNEGLRIRVRSWRK